jgi:MEDS: MEthanogen/methylotroph, DcmR Sensory domain
MKHESRHQCLIYEGSPSLKLPMLTATIQQKMDEGYRCLYLNSPPMVAGIRSYLAAKSMDVANEIAKARLVLSSEPTSVGNNFNIYQMLFKLEDALDQALNDGYKGLWATGDMTWEFGPQKDFSRLVEYEWRLEELFRKRPELCGICQYHRDTLPREVMRQGLLMHHTIFINETLSRINPHYAQSGLSTQQRATIPELDEAVTALCQLENTKS